MKVKNILRVYADHIKDEYLAEAPVLSVKSDSCNPNFVWIKTPTGSTYKVLARELKAAIVNATNTAKF